MILPQKNQQQLKEGDKDQRELKKSMRLLLIKNKTNKNKAHNKRQKRSNHPKFLKSNKSKGKKSTLNSSM